MNPIWHYPDSRGVWQTGQYEGHKDFGGTDVPYFFRSDAGAFTVCSGSRLRQAHRVWPERACPATCGYVPRTLTTTEDTP